jgi:hypothetical protein
MPGSTAMREPPDACALRALAARAEADGADAGLVARARAIAAREDAAGASPVAAWAKRLTALYAGDAATGPEAAPDVLERRLAAELRGGARRAAVRAHLIATVRDKLAEVAPELIATWPVFGPGRDDGVR